MLHFEKDGVKKLCVRTCITRHVNLAEHTDLTAEQIRERARSDDPRVREGIKEIAQLDGAIVVSAEGFVEAAARYIDAPADNIVLAKGLGARHWAAAAISRKTNAVAVAVSQSNGTVRIFQNGEVTLRIEPFRRAMKWKDFEYEPPPAE